MALALGLRKRYRQWWKRILTWSELEADLAFADFGVFCGGGLGGIFLLLAVALALAEYGCEFLESMIYVGMKFLGMG